MNKILVIGLIGLMCLGLTSAYFCIDKDDNISVQEFKSKINVLGVYEEIKNNVTTEAFKIKMKYFYKCD